MSSNFITTGILLMLLTAILVGAGAAVGGPEGMVIAFVIALGINAYSYWNSDTVVLRMFKAQEVSPQDAPRLYEIVARLCERAGLPMPRIYILPSPQPNAFATGRNPSSSAVCVSTGLLDTLSLQELAGVLAHELAHVRNRDTLTMTVAATIAGAISLFAQGLQFGLLTGGARRRSGWLGILVAAILAPFAAMLVQMAISRSREYEADRIGAWLCGNPLWLASALRKIQAAAQQVPNEDAERAPAAAHLFIVNPLTGRGFDNWFMTHPDTGNRIAELERLAVEFQQPGADAPQPLEIGADIAMGPFARPDDRAGDPGLRGPWG